MTTQPQLQLPGLAMSEEDAYVEAFKRWGNAAYVREVPKLPWQLVGPRVCQVGILYRLPTVRGERGYPAPREVWQLHGEGPSWEDALADADRTAHLRGGL